MPQRPPRGIKYDRHAQAELADGINLVARVVSATLGPHGRVVMMDSRFGTPEISVSAMDSKGGAPVLGNDGYAIAREILTSNTYLNQGVFLARDAGKMAKRGTGDGSTTAIVLSDALVRGGMRVVRAGFEPVAVGRGIREAAEQLVASLTGRSAQVAGRSELAVVARQASGDVAVAEALAGAVESVGSENILLEEGGLEQSVTVDVDESFAIAGGYIDANLLPDRTATEAVLEDALVFVSSADVDDMRAFARVLDVARTSGRPLLSVATGFGADVLATITVNSLNRRATCVPVAVPGHGVTRHDALEDLAVFTGATLLDRAGLAFFGQAGHDSLGSAGSATVGRSATVVREGGADPETLRLRVGALAAAARDADSLHDRDESDGRRARLSGRGHATVRVGAPTDVERRERYRRALDALEAVRRAVASGVVPGGGAALLRAGATLERPPVNGHGHGEAAGFDVVRRAAEEPARVLARNGGWDAAEVVGRLRQGDERLAFDTISGEFCDGIDAGIVDPAEVVAQAVMVAASTAVTVLQSSVVIAQPLAGGRYAGTVAEGGPANLTMR